MVIGTNVFRWTQEYRIEGTTLDDHLEEAVAMAARAGLEAWEPFGVPSDADAERLKRALDVHGLRLASIYLNARLHDETWPESVAEVLRQARRAKALGANIVCLNPEPLSWRDPLDKSDDELSVQLGAMFSLCQELRSEDMRLAYHVHASELRRNGKEFYFMLDNVPAELMDFCFDVHWVYRGFGNRQKAVEDVLTKYGPRIISLHVRQSEKGIWTETLRDGDVDYASTFAFLKRTGFDGPVHVELGYEDGVPRDLGLEEAHRQSVAWLRGRLSV
jgi:inosose dehydratase